MQNCTLQSSIIISLVFGLPVSLFSQTNENQKAYWKNIREADHDTSRVLAYLDYGECFHNSNYDTAEYYYNKAGDLASKIGFQRGYHKYISYLSGIYNIRGEYQRNINLCRHGYDIATGQENMKMQGIHLTNIGNSYLYMGNNDSAAWYILASSRCFEQSKDSMILGQAYSNLSTIFINLNQFGQSIYYNKQALRIAQATNDQIGVGYALTNLGATYLKISNYDSANFYFDQAYPIAKQYNIKDLEISVAINLGIMAITKKEFDAAKSYFENAIQLSEELEHDYGIVGAKKGLANIYIQQRKFTAAIKILNNTIDLAISRGFTSELVELYKMLFEAAKENNNYTVALDAYQKHIQIRDSFSDLEIQKNIALLEKQYQTERKEKMILQKDTQIKSQQLQLQAKNTWIWVLASMIALAALISFLVWNIYKQKKIAAARQQQLRNMKLSMQAKEEERHRIARELHDDLGGTLSGIVVQTHFMSQQVEHHNVTALQKSIDKILQASSEMITKLNDIIWLVNPNYDTLEKLVQKIEEFANDMAKAKGMDVRIDTIENYEPLALNTQARKNIYLICKEAINNAVKYSQASELYLSIARSGEELKLLIEDNGKGFDTSSTPPGNGLNNMKERASNIGALYSIGTGNKKGTRISLHYNIPQ